MTYLEIKSYEERRKSLIFFIFFSQIFYVGVSFILYKNSFFNNDWFFWGDIGGYIILWIITIGRISRLNGDVKKYVLRPLLKKYGLEYEPYSSIDQSFIAKSDLIDEDYDDFEGSDLIIGDEFRFSYVKLTREEEYTTTNDRGESETRTRTVTVFDGIFYMGTFPQKIKGTYLVEKNTFHLSDILPITVEKNRIKLDMPEFEKVFDVYGSDQIEGRYIFDFTFMQKLLDIYKVVKFNKMSIKEGFYFMTFPGLDIEVPLFKNIEESIERDLNLILFLSKINEKLFQKGNK